MTKRTRETHSPDLEAKVALAAIKGEKILVELVKLFDVHPHQMTAWKAQLQEGAVSVFCPGRAAGEAVSTVDLKLLNAKIGEQTQDKDFLSDALRSCLETLPA